MKTYIKKALLAFSLTLVTVCSYASSTLPGYSSSGVACFPSGTRCGGYSGKGPCSDCCHDSHICGFGLMPQPCCN